jgi:V/A-type H+-transporting ATPase subunit I
MIVKMHKYSFLVFYKEYKIFLEYLQQLGVLHVIEKNETESNEIKQKYLQISLIEKTIQFLEKRENKQTQKVRGNDASEIMNQVIINQNKLEVLKQELDETKKMFEKANPWGGFSHELNQKLKDESIHVKFFTTSKKKYLDLVDSDFLVEIISEQGSLVYFVLIQKGDGNITIDAEEVKLPGLPALDIENKTKEIEIKIEQVNTELDVFAGSIIPMLEQNKSKKLNALKFENVIINTKVEAEKKLMVLEGWIPSTRKASITNS